MQIGRGVENIGFQERLCGAFFVPRLELAESLREISPNLSLQDREILFGILNGLNIIHPQRMQRVTELDKITPHALSKTIRFCDLKKASRVFLKSTQIPLTPTRTRLEVSEGALQICLARQQRELEEIRIRIAQHEAQLLADFTALEDYPWVVQQIILSTIEKEFKASGEVLTKQQIIEKTELPEDIVESNIQRLLTAKRLLPATVYKCTGESSFGSYPTLTSPEIFKILENDGKGYRYVSAARKIERVVVSQPSDISAIPEVVSIVRLGRNPVLVEKSSFELPEAGKKFRQVYGKGNTASWVFNAYVPLYLQQRMLFEGLDGTEKKLYLAEAQEENQDKIYRYQLAELLSGLGLREAVEGMPEWGYKEMVEFAMAFSFEYGREHFEDSLALAREVASVSKDPRNVVVALIHLCPEIKIQETLMVAKSVLSDESFRRLFETFGEDRLKNMLALFLKHDIYSHLECFLQNKDLPSDFDWEESDALQNYMDMLMKAVKYPNVFIFMLVNELKTLKEIDQIPDEASRQRIFERTLNIYVPLARRLGLADLAEQLENQAFRLQCPEVYFQIIRERDAALQMKPIRAKQHLEAVANLIETELERRNISARVLIRSEKTPFSIDQKLKAKPDKYPRIENLQDLLGIKIIIAYPDPEQLEVGFEDFLGIYDTCCSFGENIEDQFEYSGKGGICHIGIIEPEGRAIEFQVMTEKAFQEEQTGEYDHEAYKVLQRTGQKLRKIKGRRLTGNFEDDFKRDRELLRPFRYVWYVGEKKGRPFKKIIRIPVGAIPEDFAAHPRVDRFDENYGGLEVAEFSGNWDNLQFRRCVSTTELRTMQVVRVISSPGSQAFPPEKVAPVLSRAQGLRTKIQALFFDKKRRPKLISAGAKFLEHTLGTSVPRDVLAEVAAACELKNIEELYGLLGSELDEERAMVIEKIKERHRLEEIRLIIEDSPDKKSKILRIKSLDRTGLLREILSKFREVSIESVQIRQIDEEYPDLVEISFVFRIETESRRNTEGNQRKFEAAFRELSKEVASLSRIAPTTLENVYFSRLTVPLRETRGAVFEIVSRLSSRGVNIFDVLVEKGKVTFDLFVPRGITEKQLRDKLKDIRGIEQGKIVITR